MIQEVIHPANEFCIVLNHLEVLDLAQLVLPKLEVHILLLPKNLQVEEGPFKFFKIFLDLHLHFFRDVSREVLLEFLLDLELVSLHHEDYFFVKFKKSLLFLDYIFNIILDGLVLLFDLTHKVIDRLEIFPAVFD